MTLRQIITRNLLNIPGWHTKRKIVVIESDDWGSIRMPSRKVYEKCLKAGFRVDLNEYERYDSLASGEDLNCLFNVLQQYKDYKGNHPIITANCVVANPNFEKIKASNYQQYHYELITDTFKKYPSHNDNFRLWQQGIDMGIFYPQYHAREHLNVSKFMKALQSNDSDVHWSFDHQIPGGIRKGNGRQGNKFVQATKYNSEEDRKEKLNIYLEGLDVFERLFGYRSESVIPTNYIWHEDYDSYLAQSGVKFIQGIRKFYRPDIDKQIKTKNRILGRRTNGGLIELVRDAWFEPSILSSRNTIVDILQEIDIAFRMRKPAIISSHRINFVGFIERENRDKNLKMLDKVLAKIIAKHPDVEFMTSDQLGKIIEDDNRDS